MSKRFSLIYQGTVYPKDNAKIIPEEDYVLLVSAEEILEKAKEDAKNLEESAKIKLRIFEDLRFLKYSDEASKDKTKLNFFSAQYAVSPKKEPVSINVSKVPLIFNASIKSCGAVLIK